MIVEGALSDSFDLSNMIYQGTVLGPPLWNAFFHDVVAAAEKYGGQASIFADDLNIFKMFDVKIDNFDIMICMELTREEIHKWGRRNRVTFEASKGDIAILHPVYGEGNDFKMLGCIFDTKLYMQSAIDKIVSKTKSKIQAMTRTIGIYNEKDIIQQFKTHIWGYTEYINGASMHATDTSLNRLDKIRSVRGEASLRKRRRR